jgi:hypothetical protein
MLFAQPSSDKDHEAGDVSMGMDVDSSMREEPIDVDMYNDSPVKMARSTEHTESSNEVQQDSQSGESSKATASSLLATVLRPINANAVKRVEKQRSKAPHSKIADKSAETARGEDALVLRNRSAELDHEVEGDVTEESLDEDENDAVSSIITGNPKALRGTDQSTAEFSLGCTSDHPPSPATTRSLGSS